MFFDESETATVKPGVHRARIVTAVEEYFEPFGADVLSVKLKFPNGAEHTHRTKLEYTRLLSAIVRAAGVEPRGNVEPSQLVGANVMVTVEIKPNGYPQCSGFAPAGDAGQPPAKRAPKPTSSKTVNAADGGSDFPF